MNCAIPTCPPTDADLAVRSRVDVEAFGELYQRYRARTYRMVYRRLNHREAAEDVTADVFVKALRHIDGYRPATAPFGGWLHRIAGNAVIDYQRARRGGEALNALPDRADPSVRVEDEAIARVQADRVWSAVRALTGAQRTAVTLRLATDLPIAGIAGRMERSEGAVKQLLNRGMAALRTELGSELREAAAA